MKLRFPDFKKNNLLGINLFVELSITDDLIQILDEVKSAKKRGITIRFSKDKEKVRIETRLLPERKKNVEVLEQILTHIKAQGSDKANVTSTVIFSYNTKEYETDPSLPVEFPENNGKTEKVLLTGVKLNFPDSTSSLEFTTLDLRYCLTCREYHTISNQVVCRSDLAINANLLLNVVKTAKEYSQTFVKRKKK